MIDVGILAGVSLGVFSLGACAIVARRAAAWFAFLKLLGNV